MIDIYLFDWGNTLMIDFPGVTGKMCDWEVVEAVPGAYEILEVLSKHSEIYIATAAVDSTESEIQAAFKRVGLSQFISGYFCKDNLGLTKGSPEYLNAILKKLAVSSVNVAVVGDDFDRDIGPALAVGIQAFWLQDKLFYSVPNNVKVIATLSELNPLG
jgi:putative hydrolase of the HAD superfamily